MTTVNCCTGNYLKHATAGAKNASHGNSRNYEPTTVQAPQECQQAMSACQSKSLYARIYAKLVAIRRVAADMTARPHPHSRVASSMARWRRREAGFRDSLPTRPDTGPARCGRDVESDGGGRGPRLEARYASLPGLPP